MLRSVARRLLLLVPTLFGVSLIVFLFLRFIPGDPGTAILRENATAEQVAAVNERLGLNKPIYVQYGDYIGKILRGDLGEGFFSRLPVSEQLGRKFPATAELTIAAMIIAVVLGLVLGVIAALRRGSLFD